MLGDAGGDPHPSSLTTDLSRTVDERTPSTVTRRRRACRTTLDSDSCTTASRCGRTSSGDRASIGPDGTRGRAEVGVTPRRIGSRRSARSSADEPGRCSSKMARGSPGWSRPARRRRPSMRRDLVAGGLGAALWSCRPVAKSRWITRSCRSRAMRSRSEHGELCPLLQRADPVEGERGLFGERSRAAGRSMRRDLPRVRLSTTSRLRPVQRGGSGTTSAGSVGTTWEVRASRRPRRPWPGRDGSSGGVDSGRHVAGTVRARRSTARRLRIVA